MLHETHRIQCFRLVLWRGRSDVCFFLISQVIIIINTQTVVYIHFSTSVHTYFKWMYFVEWAFCRCVTLFCFRLCSAPFCSIPFVHCCVHYLRLYEFCMICHATNIILNIKSNRITLHVHCTLYIYICVCIKCLYRFLLYDVRFFSYRKTIGSNIFFCAHKDISLILLYCFLCCLSRKVCCECFAT